jgi:hypothetical protein
MKKKILLHSERTSENYRKVIGHSNLVLLGLSLSQIIIKLPEFNSQSIKLGHILPMGIQNNRRNQMVAENHPSSRTEYKNKRKKRNKEIISRREKSSNIIRKRQSLLPNKFNNF